MEKHKAYFRFYEELNDFLPIGKRKVKFEHHFIDRASVKDMIESLGVPHAEIDLILVNGKSVSFSYKVNYDDEISVYPVFESFDISDVQHLRAKPLREPKFIVDVHLGSLAKYLRMLGFDTYYKKNLSSSEIIFVSLSEQRTILTHDKNILKQNAITHRYWIRGQNLMKQIKEVVERFHLQKEINEFTRCLNCNSELENVLKGEIIVSIPPKVKENFNDFKKCPVCNKIFWKGSHFYRMKQSIEEINKSKRGEY